MYFDLRLLFVFNFYIVFTFLTVTCVMWLFLCCRLTFYLKHYHRPQICVSSYFSLSLYNNNNNNNNNSIVELLIIILVQEIGICATVITEDSRETTFLFQTLNEALQRGNAVLFLGTFTQD